LLRTKGYVVVVVVVVIVISFPSMGLVGVGVCINPWRASGCCNCVSMDGEAATGGSRTRSRTDLNLYIAVPLLPLPRVWLDTTTTSPTLMPNPTGAAPDAPRMGEESLASAVVAYSPSNDLSTLERTQCLIPQFIPGSNAGSEEDTDTLLVSRHWLWMVPVSVYFW
jgi:hypothetical protein